MSQEIVDSDFELYKRITDDLAFGDVLKNLLFDQFVRAHRQAEELVKPGESKTLEFKSTLHWSLAEDQQGDKVVTHAALKTIAAFLNTEGGDLVIGVADDGSVVGIKRGAGTVKLPPDSAAAYIRTRFPGAPRPGGSEPGSA